MLGEGQGRPVHGEGLVVDLHGGDVPELEDARGLGLDGPEHGHGQDQGHCNFRFHSFLPGPLRVTPHRLYNPSFLLIFQTETAYTKHKQLSIASTLGNHFLTTGHSGPGTACPHIDFDGAPPY